MDFFLYNYFGYNEGYIKNKKARMIQNIYRNYKNYNLQKKIDMIKYGHKLTYKTNDNINQEINDEHKFWKTQRIKIKNMTIDIMLNNYKII